MEEELATGLEAKRQEKPGFGKERRLYSWRVLSGSNVE